MAAHAQMAQDVEKDLQGTLIKTIICKISLSVDNGNTKLCQ